eukprot:9572814-Ditylum_brightwellii.AAC.1
MEALLKPLTEGVIENDGSINGKGDDCDEHSYKEEKDNSFKMWNEKKVELDIQTQRAASAY